MKNLTKSIFITRVLSLTAVALVCLIGLFFISSCSKKNKAQTNITIAGSTSVQPFAEEWAASYMQKHPNVKINVQGGGSSAGIKAAKEAVADIGTSSRDLKPEEKEGMEFKVVAKDGIAVIINPKNKVNDLTAKQIQEIFSGETTNWKKFGGEDAKINILSREEGSGTRGAFEELAMKNVKTTVDAMVQDSNGSIREMVSIDPNAIGYISLDLVDEKVKAVKINAVTASAENIKNRKYMFFRPFVFIYKKEVSSNVQNFINFVLSDEIRKMIKEQGLISAEK